MRSRKSAIFPLLSLVCGLLLVSALQSAERPAATRLLPENTLAFVRAENVPDLRQRLLQTALGRMGSDPQVRPLLGNLYTSVLEGYQRIEQRIGLPLDKLLSIPQGEVCFAVVPPQEGRPQIIVLVEAGERLADARMFIERIEEQMVADGLAPNSERVGDTELRMYEFPGQRRRRMVIFEKESAFAFSTDMDLAKQLLAVWSGDQKVTTLADNRRFAAIMNRCQGDRQDRPQLAWYVDPVELVRRTGQGNLSTQAGLALISGLGLDGLQAAGGTITLATEEFDSIVNTHLLLESPREGVLKLLAMQSGDSTPEPWVPRDVAAYFTLNWNVAQTYAELKRLNNIFRGDGNWEQSAVQPISNRLGLDLQRDVVDAVEGRFTLITWMEKPARLNSQARLVGIKLKDPAATRQTLDRVLSRFGDRMQQQTFGGLIYHLAVMSAPRRPVDEQTVRRPEPCLAILGDYLVFSDSTQLLQQAITTNGDPTQSLNEELDYKLISSKIGRQLKTEKAGLVSFYRPEEGLRLIYEIANAPTTRTRLRDQAGNNPVFRALNNALDQNPLPPFAILARYLAPGGATITSDETGFHHTGFTLRRE